MTMDVEAAGAVTPDHFMADDGTRIPLSVSGRGPDLVMIPGWTSRWQDWQPVVDRLQDRFTCHVWEARPYQAAAVAPTIERMARDLENMLDACRLERPLLMGHSMGAMISWEYLRQYGDSRLSALCIIDQSPRLITDQDWDRGLYGSYSARDNAGFVAALRHDFADTAVNGLIRRSRDGLTGSPAAEAMMEARQRFLRSVAPEPWISAWESLVAKDFRDVLPAIRLPTLLAYGAACRFYGPRVAEYVHAHTPRSELRLYDGAGHSPHLEAPDAFAKDFLEFAARHALLSV